MKPWLTTKSRVAFEDEYIKLRTDSCERHDGHTIGAYHVLEFSPWVTVIPLTDEGNVVLVREYRHAAGKIMIGLPGGVSDPGETDWADVGARELAEETGYTSEQFHPIGTCSPNPALQNNEVHYFLALGCKATAAQSLDPNEEIEVLEMPLEEFLAYETLEVQHALHASALFYMLRFFEKNPELKP